MARQRCIRSAGLAPVLALILSVASSAAAAAQGQATMGICHRTGSETNPWVFMTINEGRWPTYQAQGAFRASSAADCQQASQQAAAAQQPQTVAGQPPAAVRAQSPAREEQEVLGRQATAPAASTAPEAASARAVDAEPAVSVLPSTGEPTIPPLALVLLVAVAALGFCMRQLGRQRV
jgi:hypothetical protein